MNAIQIYFDEILNHVADLAKYQEITIIHYTGLRDRDEIRMKCPFTKSAYIQARTNARENDRLIGMASGYLYALERVVAVDCNRKKILSNGYLCDTDGDPIFEDVDDGVDYERFGTPKPEFCEVLNAPYHWNA